MMIRYYTTDRIIIMLQFFYEKRDLLLAINSHVLTGGW